MSSNSIMIDKRMKNKVESMFHHENGCCSIKFLDLEDTFWFSNKNNLQIFLNDVARERYYDKQVRKGYFTYINENEETVKYNVKTNRGTLELINEEFVN